MMPQLLTVRVKSPKGRLIRIWVPVFPVALVLSPLLILAALAAAAACLMYRISAMRAFSAGWRLFCALPGARFDMDDGQTAFFVSIR
jgi:hypothetical protein